MKALLSKTVGGPDTLVLEDVPSPRPRPGFAVVSVKAIGVNYPDVLIIEDKYQFKPARPFAPGSEISGVVKEVGEGVTHVKPGDRVLGNTGWGGMAEELALESARLIKIASRQSTHTLRRQFQSLVEFHKERFPARAWVHLALQRRNLVIGKLMTFCVSQQPVKASRNVPQMKRNRREVKRSRMQVSLAQRFAPAVYIFQCQFESVQNSARYGWYFCQCSTQPGFRLLRWRYSTLSITHSVKDLSSVEIHARLPPDRDALRRLLHSWRACRLLLLYPEAR